MVSILQNLVKDKRRRIIYKNSERKNKHFKFLKINASQIGYIAITNLTKNSVHNFCLISGHGRSVYSKHLRLSRHQIKQYFSYIKTLRLSSW